MVAFFSRELRCEKARLGSARRQRKRSRRDQSQSGEESAEERDRKARKEAGWGWESSLLVHVDDRAFEGQKQQTPRALPSASPSAAQLSLSLARKLSAGVSAPFRAREKRKGCLRGRATRLAHEELTAAAAAAWRKFVAASDDGPAIPAEGAAEGGDKTCFYVCQKKGDVVLCQRASGRGERTTGEGGGSAGAEFFFSSSGCNGG